MLLLLSQIFFSLLPTLCLCHLLLFFVSFSSRDRFISPAFHPLSFSFSAPASVWSAFYLPHPSIIFIRSSGLQTFLLSLFPVRPHLLPLLFGFGCFRCFNLSPTGCSCSELDVGRRGVSKTRFLPLYTCQVVKPLRRNLKPSGRLKAFREPQ